MRAGESSAEGSRMGCGRLGLSSSLQGNKMDAKYSGDMLKHLEQQNELLMDAYRSMSHELHKLQVEEEMLMRKFYELMTAQGFTKKDGVGTHDSGDNRSGDTTAPVIKDGDEQQ